jgi:hypothetical protein
LFSFFIFAFITVITPFALAPLNKAWLSLSLLLGRLINPIILGLIYLTVITPAAILGRLLGRDPINLKKNQATSYWIHKEQIDPDSFKDQF